MMHNEDGAAAEERVTDYLKQNGYKILDRNWKTPKCEIDIVAKKQSCIYFVEVKYRSNMSQGSGFDYITAQKIRQMSFAAENWIAKSGWDGEYCLAGASVSGKDYTVEFIDSIEY